MNPLFLLAAAPMAALALASCARNDAPAAAPLPDEATVRTTAQGEVIGLMTPDGAHSWRGLPFAAPPVGNLRWRAPRPPQAWDGARTATRYGERCTQISTRLNSGEGIDPGLLLGSEDCLYLDVYAPPDALDKAASGARLPVMVWVHGGSNVWGDSKSYDGSRLALHENVIVVSVQYRLGPFGWFAHPALREDAQTEEDRAASFAILDLIASLQWVRDNIEAFGGDAGNVTVFGESAGGHNVAALLAAPPAKGLFHRAIIQSGGFDSASLAEAEGPDSPQTNPAVRVADGLGAGTAEELRALPAKAIVDAFTSGGAIRLPRMIEDGVALPAGRMREAFASQETFNAVPVMTGTNRDEMKFFQLADPALTKKFLGVFLTSRDRALYDAASDYGSRLWRVRAVDEPAAMMAAAGHGAVYAYRFDWDEGGRIGFSDFAHLLGAGHAVEIPFVFNRFVLFGDLDKALFGKRTAASREELSRAMGAYWAAFARSGAPSAGGQPAWPPYGENGGSLMRFDSREGGGIGVIAGADSLEAIMSDLKADPRLDAERRCLVAVRMAFWAGDLADFVLRDAGCAG